jgi:hypothetical protein
MKAITILFFLLCLPLVAAVSLNVNPTDVQANEDVTLSVSCSENAVTFVRVYSPSNELVDVFQGTIVDGKYDATHKTSSDSGKYEVRASCQNDPAEAIDNFCVGISCQTATTSSSSSSSGSSSSSSSGGSSGGSRIVISTDDTEECRPSWICAMWSECVNGKQSRKCFDEKYCSSEVGKPNTQKTCDTTGVAANQRTGSQSSPQLEQPTTASSEKSLLWLWIVLGVILVAIIVVVVVILVKKHQEPSTIFK